MHRSNTQLSGLLLLLILRSTVSRVSLGGDNFGDEDDKNSVGISSSEPIGHEQGTDEYHVTIPIIYVVTDTRQEPLNSTQTEDGRFLSGFILLLSAFQKTYHISLQLNTFLFTERYIERTVDNRGRESRRYTNQTESHCFYHGQVRGFEHSSAAFSTCYGLRGQLSIDDVIYFVEPSNRSVSSINSVHYVIKSVQYNETCGQKQVPIASRLNRLRRNAFEQHTKANEPRFIELYVVNDFAQYAALGYNESAVIHRAKDIVNIVSQMYRQLNIFIVLIGIEVWTQGNLINVTAGTGDDTMNDFLEYRRDKISPQIPNDNAQLIVGGILGDGVVGKAPIMTICTHRNSGGVSSDRNAAVGVVAATVAHELGHNLGLHHDDDDSCECPDNRCIMTSSGGGWKFPTRWSECSRHQLSDSFHQGMDYCLLDKPRLDRIFDGPTCGNGLVEPGEDCDCGHDQSRCDNKCCDSNSCRLAANATCASGLCCDLTTCQSMSAGSVCRATSGVCDLDEYCDGRSPECAADVHVQDGSECMEDGLASYCYRGRCRSRESQCRRLWGSTAHDAHDLCYKHFNLLGTVNGHCGFDWTDETFTKCTHKNVMCGMLHCSHSSEKLMFWKESLAFSLQETWVTTRDEQRHDCKGAILDVGLGMHDPGSVQDGTKCGDQQLCVGHRCMSIDSLNVSGCPDCHNHGVCNSLGQCHCHAGYAPPYCDRRGHGGSLHSGPSMAVGHTLQSGIGLFIGLLVVCAMSASTLGVVVYCVVTRRSRLKKLMLSQCQPPQYDPVHKTVVTVEMNVTVEQSKVVSAQQPNAVKRSASVRRAPSFRPEDISTPRLQSSTNSAVTPLIHQQSRTLVSETSPVFPRHTACGGEHSEESSDATASLSRDAEDGSPNAEGLRLTRPTRRAPLPPMPDHITESEFTISGSTGSCRVDRPSRTPETVGLSDVVYQNSCEFMKNVASTENSKSVPIEAGDAKKPIGSSTCDDVAGDVNESWTMKPTRPPPPKKCLKNGSSSSQKTCSTSRFPTCATQQTTSSYTDENITPSVTSLKSVFEKGRANMKPVGEANCMVASRVTKAPPGPSTAGDVVKKSSTSIVRTPSNRPSVPPKPVTSTGNHLFRNQSPSERSPRDPEKGTGQSNRR